jgi:hypothetical protein
MAVQKISKFSMRVLCMQQKKEYLGQSRTLDSHPRKPCTTWSRETLEVRG